RGSQRALGRRARSVLAPRQGEPCRGRARRPARRLSRGRGRARPDDADASRRGGLRRLRLRDAGSGPGSHGDGRRRGRIAGEELTVSRRVTKLTLPLAAMLLASCTFGPNYKRPLVETPDAFRG